MKQIKLFLALGILIILSSISWADIPNLINFQGILDSAGNPMANRTVSVEFRIYDALVGGTAFWSETQSVTTNAGGVFNVLLGSSIPIPDSAFDDTLRWLGIKVGTDAEMTPRQQIVSNAYGYRVGTVDGASGGVISGDVDIQSDLTVSGKVGIATTSPQAQLHIGGGGNAQILLDNSGDLMWKNAGGTVTPVLTLHSDDNVYLDARAATTSDLIFRTNTTFLERMRITATGNVGIGTTAPNEQLELTGNLRLPASTASVGVIKSGADRFIHNFGTQNFFAGVNAGNFTLSGFGGNTGVGVSVLQALTTGYYNTAVGEGALFLNSTGSSNTAVGLGALNLNSTGMNNTAIGFGANVSLGGLTNATAIGANAVVAVSNAMVLGGTGANAVNVGIGTISPEKRLHIGGGGNAQILLDNAGDLMWKNASGAITAVLTLHNDDNVYLDATGAATSDLIFRTTTSLFERMRITDGGNVGIGTGAPAHPLHMGSGAHCTAGGTWTNASSKQLKTDIEPLQNDEYSEILEKLEKLDVVRFKYKADPKREHIGLIAEDVPDEISSDDRTGIPTADAIGFLMAALKAQQSQLEIQQNQIKELENKVKQINKEE